MVQVLVCPATRWCGKPMVSGVPGLRPERPCQFKGPGSWLGSLIVRLWMTHWFRRSWVSRFFQGHVTDRPRV